jgi:peptide/nickel transport system ATP-binding protein
MVGLLASRAGSALAKGERLAAIPGPPPDLANLPNGRTFPAHCVRAQPLCESAVPAEVAVGDGHRARCVLLQVSEVVA